MRRVLAYLFGGIILVLLLGACNAKPVIDGVASDKLRLVWNDDPTTTMTLAWNQRWGEGVLYYGEDPKHLTPQRPQRQVHYRGMNNTFARLRNLLPNHRYYFQVCTQGQCTPLSYFKTAPVGLEPFCFVAGGDSRSIPKGRIRGNRLVAKIRPLFVLHGGDFTKHGDAHEWQRWLDEWQMTRSDDGQMYPLVVTHGNHENRDHLMLNRLFDVPNPWGYFQLNFNLLSLYVLNTELEPNVGWFDLRAKGEHPNEIYQRWDEQTHWLDEALRIDPHRWKVLSYHRPLRPHRASKPEGRLRYLDWAPLLYRYGVKLAIESDSHLVKYTQPLKPDLLGEEGFVVDKQGTTFIGEGSWGAPTRANDDDKSWTLASGSFWQFKVIGVSASSLSIYTVKFGDEVTPYDPKEVESLSAMDRQANPLRLPAHLDLWRIPNRGTLLELH